MDGHHKNAPGIAQMTTSLSRLLKSIAKGKQVSIPVKAEFSLLDDYFMIQKYRYGGTITRNIKLMTKLYWIARSGFTLQPIAENAIFHGIVPKGAAGSIQLHLFFSPASDQIQIDITDMAWVFQRYYISSFNR